MESLAEWITCGIAAVGIFGSLIIQSAFVGSRNQILSDTVRRVNQHDEHLNRVDDALTQHNSDISVLQVKTDWMHVKH